MTPRLRRAPGRVWLLLPFLFSAVEAGTVQVPIRLPLPARMDTTGVRTVLVTHYAEGDHPDLSLSREMVAQIRRMIEKGTGFQVLDVEPPFLPEQALEDLINNQEYWRAIARRYGADLVLSGEVLFGTENRSGFVSEEYQSPVTGQRTVRTRYAEREAFDLEVQVFFFRGATGELGYRDRYTEEAMVDAEGLDPLQVFHTLLGRLEPEILGVLRPRKRSEIRFLFTD